MAPTAAQWRAVSQGQHLEHVYQALLAQADRVLVLGYYRNCPWTFGFWQKADFTAGPADGDSCAGERAELDGESGHTTQLRQAHAVSNDLNRMIRIAIDQARSWAKSTYPGARRDLDLAYAEPAEGQWADHQGWDCTPWVLLNDTWIHPNPAGAQHLAHTVTTGMCTSFAHWCGSPPVWG